MPRSPRPRVQRPSPALQDNPRSPRPAYAVASCPLFLILYDFLLLSPRSALDAENEYLVQEALDRLMDGRTVLIIAHRLSTIQNADAVAVLDQGRVVECGKHEQLLQNRNGIFSKLMEKQSSLLRNRNSV